MTRDSDLLFGILALQMDFLSRDRLISAMSALLLDRERSLGEILLEGGALTPERHQLLSALVREHLKAHGEDASRSLAAVESHSAVAHEALQALSIAETRIGSPDVGTAEDPHATSAEMSGPISASDRFLILRPLGRGGLGEVFVALDTELNREVALKQIREPLADNEDNQRRFLLEGEVTGGLEHPGVVPVYGLGRHADGRPFYAMRLIHGETLEAVIQRFHQSAPSAGDREVELHNLLRRFLGVCNAVSYAHSKGVLHRDLKPSNIMLGPYGETLLLDWGLAKKLKDPEREAASEGPAHSSLDEEMNVTRQGQAVGTPAFMSPEQAAGRLGELGPASDVYGLGATLYSLLTGQAPFGGPDVGAILRKVERGDFPPPGAVNRQVQPALEAICLKALALKPEDRYQSAEALTKEIEQWLAGEKVSVYRDPFLARARRWGRRHPRLVMAQVAGVGVAVAVLLLTLVFLGREERRQQAARLDAERRKEELRVSLYYSRIGQAEGELTNGNLGIAGELLDGCDGDLRGWEWHYLKRRQREGRRPPLAAHKGETVYDVAFSPDGALMAQALSSGAAVLADAATGKEVRRLRAPWQAFLPPALLGVAFSPDGKHLAGAVSSVNTGEVTIWETESGRKVHSLRGHKRGVVGVAYSPDGKILASCSWDGTVRLWDAALGTELRTLQGHAHATARIAFRPDGKHLASASWDGTVRVWEVETGQEAFHLEKGASEEWAVAYSPDGRRLAAGNMEGLVQVWDADTGDALLRFPAQMGSIQSVKFSSDSKRLAVAGWDRTVKLCDASTGQDVLTLRGHGDIVLAMAFHPDGRRLISSGWDGNVLMWDARTGVEHPEKLPLTSDEGAITALAFSADGRNIAGTSIGRSVRVWDTHSGRETRHYRGHDSMTFAVGFSRDGLHVATGGFGDVRVWELASGRDVARYTGQRGTCSALAYSPDGRLIASGAGIEGAVNLWEAATGKHVLSLNAHLLGTMAVAFSPNGKQLATGGADRMVMVWDPAKGRRLHLLEGHNHFVQGVAYSSDGKSLLSGSWDRTLKLWDVQTGKELRTFTGHEDRIMSVALSPDGKKGASASFDGTARLWDTSSGKELRVFRAPAGVMMGVAFSPDGKTLAAGGGHRNKGQINLWDLTDEERR